MRHALTMRALRPADRGFTLVEVLVALGVLMIVSLAVLPLMIRSVQSANIAKAHTQAKNLLQERVEQMRNLPFHVPYSTGAQYVDLLDIYFHDRANPSINSFCSSASFATATNTYTCNLNSTKLGFPGFTQKIETQFLDKDRNVIAPLAGYTSQSTAGTDVPPSQLIGARITVNWTQYGQSKSYSTYTQIGNGAAGKPQTVVKLRNSAVSIDSTIDDSAPATLARFDAGLISADAGVSTGATARGVATGAYSSFSSGETSSSQAAGGVDAPPDQLTFSTVTGTASSGVPCSSNIVCFGPTQVLNVTGKAAGGQPIVGTSGSPMTAKVLRSGSATDRGFWFTNVPTGTTQARLANLKVQDPLLPPLSTNPTQLVRTVQSSPSSGYTVGCTGAPVPASNVDFVTSTGYIESTGGSTHAVTACTTATTRRVDIMPTSFAPNGVVQVTLDSASLSCVSSGAASVAPASNWSGRVSYWDAALGGYQTLNFAKGSADPLTPALLTKGPGGVQVGVSPTGLPLYLGDYIKSWSSGPVKPGATTGTARQSDLTAVSITTVPTRDADTTGASSINVALGQLSCLAEDNR